MSEDMDTCSRCHGTGLVNIQHGVVYMTDSEDEIADCFHEEPCPVCVPLLMREGAATVQAGARQGRLL